MFLILGAALPPAASEKNIRRELLAALAPRMGKTQMEHLCKFPWWGPGLRAGVSRCLARLIALPFFPRESVLEMDGVGRPYFSGNAAVTVAFSHSGSAAFCGLCVAEKGWEAAPLAIDAETLPIAPYLEAMSSFLARIAKQGVWPDNALRILKLWLRHECGLKLRRRGAGASHPAIFADNTTHHPKICFQERAFPGHLVRIAHEAQENRPAITRWFNYRDILRAIKRFSS